ncbi:sugar porter family MFS transporter [Streptomyces tendae]|uniref:sugar porter family MFS transporter n=1 Tax=Streptomyces tendae TaxID=1932 RepID=UPI00379C4B44
MDRIEEPILGDDYRPGRVRMLAVSAAVAGFLFGFDSSVINGAVSAISDHFGLSDGASGLAVASALLGCAFGAYLAGSLADRWGRTRIMFWAAVLFLVSSVGSAFAFALWDFVAWRLVGGMGIGTASVIAPAYISEIAPKDNRGRLGSLQQLAITIGIFAALLSDQLFADFAGGASEVVLGLPAWRWMFLVGVVPALVYGFIALTLPESPRFLITQGRTEEARSVLGSLVPHAMVEVCVREIEDGIRSAATEKGSLRGPRFGLQPIVWVGIILFAFQQFVGINVIFYYSTTLWQAVGFEESDSFLISTLTSVLNVAVTFIAIGLVDRVGRKPLLVAGAAGMFVSLLMVAVSFSRASVVDGTPHLPHAWGIVALVFANLFVVAFGSTWGPVVVVLLSESFPNRVRGTALGLSFASNWTSNFVVTLTFPVLSAASLPMTYGLYCLVAFAATVFAVKQVRETKGMSLEEIASRPADGGHAPHERHATGTSPG